MPVGDPGLRVLLLAAAPEEGVAEVVVRAGTQGGIVGGQRLAEGVHCFLVLFAHVGAGPGVELQAVRLRVPFGQVLVGAVGLVVVALPVEVQRIGPRRAICRPALIRRPDGQQRARQEQQRRHRRDNSGRGGHLHPPHRHGDGIRADAVDGSGRAPAAALAGQDAQGDARQGHHERPLVTLDGTAGRAGVDLAGLELAEPVLDQRAHRGLAAGEAQVKSVAGPGDLVQRGFIEPRADDLAVLVPDELPRTPARQRDQRAFRRAEAHGEHPDPGRRGVLGGLDPGGLLTLDRGLAVGQQEDGAVARLVLAEGFQGQVDGPAQVGAAARDQVGVQFGHGIEHGVVVDGQRGLEEGAARERHQPQAVALEQANEVVDGEFLAGEPVRREVRGQHALGHVGDDDQVQAAPVGLARFVAPARLRGGQDQAGEPEQEEGVAHPAAQAIGDPGQLLAQPGAWMSFVNRTADCRSAQKNSAASAGTASSAHSQSGAPKFRSEGSMGKRSVTARSAGWFDPAGRFCLIPTVSTMPASGLVGRTHRNGSPGGASDAARRIPPSVGHDASGGGSSCDLVALASG